MKIEHIAIWVEDLEKMKSFYTRYFQLKSNEKYVNQEKGFSSYFLSFGDGPRIELMHRDDVLSAHSGKGNLSGLAHFAISVGSKEKVDLLTYQLMSDGVVIYGEPRITGDGYYESVVLDPEGNKIEITV